MRVVYRAEDAKLHRHVAIKDPQTNLSMGRTGATFQPSAQVNGAYQRVIHADRVGWQGRIDSYPLIGIM